MNFLLAKPKQKNSEKYYTYDTSKLDQKKKVIQTRNTKFKKMMCAG